MHSYRLPLGLALVTALTIAGGIIHGKLTNRWGISSEAAAAGQSLEEVPTQVGDWKMTSSDKLDDSALNMLQPAGYLLRRYENQKTGRVADVMVLVGSVGETSVHTPEVCMGTQTYDPEGKSDQVSVTAGPQTDEFWCAKFRSKSLDARRLEVFYAWGLGDRWSAAKDPRFGFVGSPYLYKIQVTGARAPSGKAEDGPCYEFLQAFLPAVKKHLISP